MAINPEGKTAYTAVGVTLAASLVAGSIALQSTTKNERSTIYLTAESDYYSPEANPLAIDALAPFRKIGSLVIEATPQSQIIEQPSVAPTLPEIPMPAPVTPPAPALPPTPPPTPVPVAPEKAPTRTSGPGPDPDVKAGLEKLAQCESGSKWDTNTGNGFYGGLQIMQATWNAHDGQQYAARPDLATEAQQLIIGQDIQRTGGWGQWPACSIKVGLR